MLIRLSGTPLFSWLAFGALLLGIGATMTAAGGSVTQRSLGTALVCGGIVTIASTLRMRVEIRERVLLVKNRIRTWQLPFDQIAEVRSTVVETPLTRANGWGRLEVVDVDGRRVPLSASTGLARHKMRTLLNKLAATSPDRAVSVDETAFPPP